MTWLEGPHGPLATFAYPVARPWLRLVISHGFGEHSGWWHHVATALRAQGVSATLFDHYHHGRSAGAPGDVPDYARLVDGLCSVLAHTAQAPPLAADNGDGADADLPAEQPLAILAHSNGALVTLLALGAAQAPQAGPPPPELSAVRALVFASPFLDMPLKLTLLGGLTARLLSLLGPRRRVRLAIRPWRLTGCRRIWSRYWSDPLRLHAISPRFFLAMRRAVRAARGAHELGPRPLLMLRAGRERVVNTAAMERWYAAAHTPDKSRRDYPALRHELFNETDWERVLGDVVAWCRTHVPGVAPADARADGPAGGTVESPPASPPSAAPAGVTPPSVGKG